MMFMLGAGASVDSGYSTYRGVNGIYEDKEKCNSENPLENPLHWSAVWDDKRRSEMWHIVNEFVAEKDAKRNVQLGPTYLKIRSMIELVGSSSFIVTQNIDGLIHKCVEDIDPGKVKVAELHGNLDIVYCVSCGIAWPLKVGEKRVCELCGSDKTRPNIVLYGETVPMETSSQVSIFIKRERPKVLYVIGTTLQFPYLQDFIDLCRRYGAKVIHVNPDPDYKHHSHKLATKMVPGSMPRSVIKRRKRPDVLITPEEFLTEIII